jgi:hypothetical protein
MRSTPAVVTAMPPVMAAVPPVMAAVPMTPDVIARLGRRRQRQAKRRDQSRSLQKPVDHVLPLTTPLAVFVCF